MMYHTTTTTTFFLVFLGLNTLSLSSAQTVPQRLLRGNSNSNYNANANDSAMHRKLPQFGVGCNLLTRLATIRSVYDTVLYLNRENQGEPFVAAYRPDQLTDGEDHSEWILNIYPCPDTQHTNSDEKCVIFSNLHDDSRLIHPTAGNRVRTTETGATEVTATQFWKMERESANSNRYTLFNAGTGRLLIAQNSGSGNQLSYGQSNYNLENRFWTLDERWHCLW